jgi:TolB protein
MHRALIAAGLLLACARAGSALPASSALPGADGLVVADTNRGFVLLNAVDSSVVARIPGTGRLDRSPAFSPGGRRIAFASFRQGDSEIYVMDVNGRRMWS